MGIWLQMKRRRITTNNKEIYIKFKNLFIVPEVIVRGVKPNQIEKIIKGINKNSKVLDVEQFGNDTIIKRVGSLNFEIYLR